MNVKFSIVNFLNQIEYMNKCYILITIFLFATLFVSANPEQNQVDNWIEASIKQKAKLRVSLVKANMPVVSAWIKAKQKAVPMSADLTGQEKLVLVTSAGPDGNNWDWGTWANAKLIKADGSSVWLDELEPEYWTSGTNSIPKNVDIYGNPLVIAGKKYDHSVLCHANGVMVYDINKEYVRFETEVGLSDQSTVGSVFFRIMNVYPKEEAAALLAAYPEELTTLNMNIDGLETWLTTCDASAEHDLVLNMATQLKKDTFVKNAVKKIEAEKDVNTQIREYLKLYEKIQRICGLQRDLSWLNIEAIRLAFNDMKKMKEFDVSKYQPVLNELEKQVAKGFDDIYGGDDAALDNAEKAIANKRTILLANPFLDGDKVLASRFKLGKNAHKAMAPELGTQANNWSNQESAPRNGFDADIVELSNLRGDVQVRSVYKPDNGSSIADLRLHWDGDRAMFTQTMPDKRWNVFEVKLDGTGLKQLINNEEPDLEFYDGTYLPDGRIIANSNIGYQGVPCVNGDDPVGNMVLYSPENQNLRRLTFDQDANWNPVIMNNGRVMYTRWEYTDLTHYYSRIVMSMNPDGTEQKALYGSGSMFPNSTFDIQPLPNHGSAFVGIISGHHGIARNHIRPSESS